MNIECHECKGEGRVPHYDHVSEQECWFICDSCEGEGEIADPEDFTNTLSLVVNAKEVTYED